MERPFTLDRSLDVARPPHEVFAYIADFARIAEWDPMVRAAERLTPGAPGPGSRFRVVLNSGLELEYRIVEWEPQCRLAMTVTSRLFSAREELRVERTTTGTRVRYLAHFDFPRALATLAHAFPAAMQRVGDDAIAGLRHALEDRQPVPSTVPARAACDRLLLPALLRFTRRGYEHTPARRTPISAWLGERHILVTGATSGIGFAAAMELARRGAALTLVARDGARAERAARAITAATGNAAIAVEIADLVSTTATHALCERLLAAGRPIDALVNNAGAIIARRERNAEGIECSYALLLLAPYILGERLRPLLAQRGAGRIVNVLSGGLYTQRLDVDALRDPRAYDGATAYAQAKRGLLVLGELWAERWREDGIVVNAMHPGWVDTPGLREALPRFRRATRPWLRTPEQGADTIVWLAAATEAGKVSGGFWLDRAAVPAHLSRRTREVAGERERLLALLEADLRRTRARAPRQRARR